MSSILLAALLAVTASSPAPLIRTAPSAPPSPIAGPGWGRATQTIALQIRQDGRVLWSGDLTRAPDGMASISQQIQESRVCPGDDASSRGGSRGVSFNVAINPGYPAAPGVIRVSVERSRPLDEAGGCGAITSSSVRFEGNMTLVPGQPVTLNGESGLSVTLTLR